MTALSLRRQLVAGAVGATMLVLGACGGSAHPTTPAPSLETGADSVQSAHLRGTAHPHLVFPVAGSARFASGFGDAREGGRKHHGQDLFCTRSTPLLAVVDGTVDWVATQRPKPGRSYSLLLRGDDGNLYFYDHLNNDDPGTTDDAGPPSGAYAHGLKNGDRVHAGDTVAYAGDSGNAAPSGPHLHFEIHVGAWGNAIDPAPALRDALSARQAGRTKS